MNNIINIAVVVIILLGGLIGFKKGAIKEFVSLVGLVTILIIAYVFKDTIANLLIKNLPFFNFAGRLNELYSVNIMFYKTASFIVVFILLDCFLNILISLSGFVDVLVKMSLVFEIPSKILGTLLGMLTATFYLFLIGFILLDMPHTQSVVMDITCEEGTPVYAATGDFCIVKTELNSNGLCDEGYSLYSGKCAKTSGGKNNYLREIVQKMPIVNAMFQTSIASSENAFIEIEQYNNGEDTANDTNLQILTHLVRYGIVTSTLAQEEINAGKLNLTGVVVAS